MSLINSVAPRAVVMASGAGTTAAALLDDPVVRSHVACVVSNVEGAGVEQVACDRHVPYVCVPSRGLSRLDHEAAVRREIEKHDVTFIWLAGYMRILSESFVKPYFGRMVNVHPSLLPRYPGLETYKRALEAGDAWHGTTFHFVTEHLDAGPIIARVQVRVLADDTVETLRDRVQQAERRMYPRVARHVLCGDVTLGRLELTAQEPLSCSCRQQHARVLRRVIQDDPHLRGTRQALRRGVFSMARGARSRVAWRFRGCRVVWHGALDCEFLRDVV